MSSPADSRGAGGIPAFAPILAAVAGVAYSAWILQFFVNPRLDPVNGYVSELSATDQPHHDLFSAADFLSGTLSILVAAFVLRRWRPRGWAAAGWAALAVFGAFSIADSLSAMDCAPNSDTTCALRERAGKVSFAHQFHSVTSALVVVSGIAGIVALTIAARRRGGLPMIARWSREIAIAETVTAVATLPLMYFGVLLGVMERVQVIVISLWLFVIAGELHAARRRTGALARAQARRDAAGRTSAGAAPPGLTWRPATVRDLSWHPSPRFGRAWSPDRRDLARRTAPRCGDGRSIRRGTTWPAVWRRLAWPAVWRGLARVPAQRGAMRTARVRRGRAPVPGAAIREKAASK